MRRHLTELIARQDYVKTAEQILCVVEARVNRLNWFLLWFCPLVDFFGANESSAQRARAWALSNPLALR